MTNERILKEAIKKAEKSGYKVIGELDDKALSELYGGEYKDQGETFVGFVERAIIFDHKFAKAFWGNKPSCGNPLCETCPGAWAHRIQDMATQKNPVQYLAKFL